MQSQNKISIKQEIYDSISLSVPLIGSWVIYAFSGFLGTAMVARLGHDALAASVLVNTLWAAISVFFIGVFTAVCVLVAHEYGAKNYLGISKIIGQAFILALIMLVPVIVAIAMLPHLLQLSAQTASVMALAVDYAHAMVWSAPGIILLVALENFLNGIGRTKLSLWVSIIQVPIEVFFMYVFIFGKLGMPNCGIAGVGYGLAMSFMATNIILIIYLSKASFAQPFQIFKHLLYFDKKYFLEILKIGMPIGFMYLIEVAAFAFATFLMSRFSTLVLAAHQIVMQYLGLTINSTFALSQATSIRVGQFMGQKNLPGVRVAGYVGMCSSFILMTLVAIVYWFAPRLLLQIDLDIHAPENAELVKSAILLLGVLAVFQMFESIRIIVFGALRGIKDTRYSMYVSLFSFWAVGIVGAWLFGFVLHMQGVGIWIGLSLGSGLGALLLLRHWHQMLKQPDLDSHLINN